MILSGKKFAGAAYLRLSREDGDKSESDSIGNQRELIADYVSHQQGLTIVSEYVDDGHTGTNFERPAFMRMMEDVKSGKINCIIVKDLSRFGRNYIETGRYLEKIFPLMGVRFVSILDQYDNSGEGDDVQQMIVPFKNLINDAYCRDISAKIRSQLDVKRKNGKFIGSFACYGYRKDPKDKNHLVIDQTAAETVRMIFRMKLEGSNSKRIAETLNGIGILPPAEYKRNCQMNYDCGFRSGKNPKWEIVSVNRILTNEIYTGTMVQGINRKVNYRIKLSRPVPKEEWTRVEGTHEAIIERAVFDNVQKLFGTDTRTAPGRETVYMFSGIVVCKDCKENMVRRTSKRAGKVYGYYHCSTYKSGKGCTSHLLSVEKLENIVLKSVRTRIGWLVRAEEALKRMDCTNEEQTGIKLLNSYIEAEDNEIERYNFLKTKVYTDMLDELITREEYEVYSKRFSEKQDAAKVRKTVLLDKKCRLLANKIHLKPWIEEFKQYKDIEKLERQVVVKLIECIEIGSKDEVTVHYRHEDEMKELFEFVGIFGGDDGEMEAEL